jgi:hypothetical protein
MTHEEIARELQLISSDSPVKIGSLLENTDTYSIVPKV